MYSKASPSKSWAVASPVASSVAVAVPVAVAVGSAYTPVAAGSNFQEPSPWASESDSFPGKLPFGLEIVLDYDLPNGAYAELNAMGSGKVHVLPGCNYNLVASTALKAHIKGRGDLMETVCKRARTIYRETWKVVEIEYKGAPVNKFAQAAAGSHTLTFGINQNLKQYWRAPKNKKRIDDVDASHTQTVECSCCSLS